MLLASVTGGAFAQTWTDITDSNVATSEDNLLQNPDFATLGTVKSGSQYNIGEPWTWSIGSANIRVEEKTIAKSGNILIWRGSGNNNYISQPVVGIEPNTWYEVKMSQVANGNASATFNVGIGTEAGKYDIASGTVKLGSNSDGVKTIHFITPSAITESTTYYFTFANTANNTASAGSDPVTQIDWISLVECCEDQISGTYYLYNEESGQFYSRGSAWGTRSITDFYGYPVNISHTDVNAYTIKMLDVSQSKGLGSNLYTDNDSPVAWTFNGDNTDGFTIYNSELGYFSVGGNHADTKCVSDVTEASKWKLITQDEHKAIIANQLAGSRLGAIVAAGFTGVTAEDADNFLKNNYIAKDYTSKIQSASLTGINTGWTPTATEHRGFKLTTNENGSEIYQGVGKLTQTVSNLDKGIYKVTIQGFYRDGNNANCVIYDNAGWQMSNMYLQANNFETRIMGWAENRAGDANPNSMSEYKTLADNGKYMNTFYTYVGEDGQLALTLGLPSYPVSDNGFWAIFSNVTLTYYNDQVSDEDATALLSTIPSGKMYSATAEALETAKTNFNAYKTIVNYNALKNAIDAANTSIADYANLNAQIAIAEAYKVIYPDNVALYAQAITDAKAVYNNGTEETCAATISSLTDYKVADYTYVSDNFKYSVDLDEKAWKTTGYVADFDNQHWSGTEHQYKNQDDSNGRGWNSSTGFTIGLNQDVTLPAGKYVFKACGRKSAGATMELSVKAGSTDLGTVTDFPNGSSARGINKNGETSFDEGNDAYANNGNGFGWQWRFIAFELTEETTINVSVSASATVAHEWASFGDYSVITDNEANLAMMTYNVALNSAKIAIANDTYKNVTGLEKTNLQTLIDADMTGKSSTEIESATTELKSATTAFTAAAPAYDALVATLAKVEGLDAAGKEYFNSIAEMLLKAYEANEVYAEYFEGIENVYKSAIKNQGANSDWTGLLVNPSFEDATGTFPNGWTTDRNTTGSFDYKLLEETLNTNETTDGKYVLNAWAPQINYIYVKQIVNLPAGVYKLSAAVYSDKVKDQHVEAIADGTSYKSATVANNNWETLSTTFVVYKEGDVTVGIFSNGNNLNGDTYGWFRADNFKLTYLGSDIPVTIGESGYASFSATSDVVAPEGVEAFYASEVTETSVKMTKIEGGKIPANTGVILKGAKGDYTLTATTETLIQPAGNLLVAVTSAKKGLTATEGSNTNYVLKNGQFVTWTEGVKTNVAAGKAYLSVPSSSAALSIDFGDATAINTVNANTFNGARVNLAGQVVGNGYKGIVIENGKKVLVK